MAWVEARGLQGIEDSGNQPFEVDVVAGDDRREARGVDARRGEARVDVGVGGDLLWFISDVDVDGQGGVMLAIQKSAPEELSPEEDDE